MRIGALIVGLRGATASTTVAAALGCDPEALRPFLITETGSAARLPLVRPDEIVFGGWDTFEETWAETLQRHGVLDHNRLPGIDAWLEDKVHVFEAAALRGDYAVVSGETDETDRTGAKILDDLRADIRRFKEAAEVDRVVVVQLGAPGTLVSRARWPKSARGFVEALQTGLFRTAAPYYAGAALLEGCALVDYTASATLEVPGLVALAEREGVPVAGRDGSTGQTLLKSVIAQTFATRRLTVRGWYSTNILGNHDGLMLSDPRFSDIKKVDKTALLEQILGYPVQSHLVDIRHYPPAGDDKEAWDAVDFEGLMGARGRLRLDWQCSDSLLAAPAVIDLIRLSAHLLATGRRGLQDQLGLFFKHPLGTEERRYLRLYDVLERFCAREITRLYDRPLLEGRPPESVPATLPPAVPPSQAETLRTMPAVTVEAG